MSAAVYCRLSADRSGLSEAVEIQEQECQAWALDIEVEVAGVFVDNDISASRYSTKPRPGYGALVDAIQGGAVDTVIVTEMTRLYRRLEELLQLIKLAETTALRRIVVTDGTGYNLSTGEGIFNAVSAVNTAMLESRKISDRVKRRKRTSAMEGKTSGGSRPYGYEQDAVTVRDDEAAVLRECVRRVIGGERVTVITRDLNERGVPTAQGAKWRVENLKRLLESKRYIGIRTHNGAEYPAVWPSIITNEEHELLRLTYKDRTNAPIRPKGKRSYLLTGFAYCGNCGNTMSGNSQSYVDKRPSTRRYKCRKLDNHGLPEGCGKVFRSAEPLERWVAEAILYRLDTLDLAQVLSGHDEAPATALLMDRYEVQRGRLDELVGDYATGLLTRQQFIQAKALAERALDATRTEMSQVQRRRTLIALPETGQVTQAWKQAGLDWRRQLVGLLVERVVVLPGHPGGHYWQGFRFQPKHLEIVWRA